MATGRVPNDDRFPASHRERSRTLQSETVLQPLVDRLDKRSPLSEAEQRQVLDWPVRESAARANHEVIRVGERVDHACFVVDGLLGSCDLNARGDRQITALHIAGDMPNLHSVTLRETSLALFALTTTTMLFVPHEAIRASARNFPALAEALWRDCMVDAMILAQWVVNVGRRQSSARIAHLLCEMACRYKAPRSGRVVFHLPMTQEHLADATGITPVHVNRTLRALQAIGTTFHHGTVRVQDWDALKKAGEFDDAYLHLDERPARRPPSRALTRA